MTTDRTWDWCDVGGAEEPCAGAAHTGTVDGSGNWRGDNFALEDLGIEVDRRQVRHVVPVGQHGRAAERPAVRLLGPLAGEL